MLRLMAIVFYGGMALVVVVVLLTILFKLLLMTLVILRSVIAGVVIVVAGGGLATASYYFLLPKSIDLLPSFHKAGDGGWGIGVDLVAQSALKVFLPLTTTVLFCLLIFATVVTV